jgi:glucose-1-phosphatase
LFDLGHVLIDSADFSKILEWESWTDQLSEVEKRYMESDYVRDYQKGIIGTKEYVEAIISELDLTVNVSRFLREFRLLPRGFYPGAEALLKRLSHNYTTACLSNTNEMHWNKLCDVDKLDKYFKVRFPSHMIHEIKPEKEAYTYVIDALGVDPGAIAFFDDRIENVEAAKDTGIDAYTTNGFKELCDCISELGIL